MITQYRPAYYDNPRASTLSGLSTDQKPTDVENGARYEEIDTGKAFCFDKENKAWYEMPQSGGGGSSVSVEPITITKNGVTTAPDGVAYSPITTDTYTQDGDKITITEDDGSKVVFTQGEAQAEKTVDININGAFIVEPDAGYAFVKRVIGSVDVPAPEPTAQVKTVTITANGTTEVTPDDGYEFLTRVTVNTNVPIPTAPKITITELSTTETVGVLSYGSFVRSVFVKNGGSVTKQLMGNGFEKIIFSADVDGLMPNIPIEYNVDEAATLLLNMNQAKTIGVIFRGAPGQILVNVNESTSLAIDITPEIITTITQQTTAYIRTALGSDTIGVTCHDYIHANMMDLGE